ncbi:MAG: YHS domain-containing protein [Planctomycetes bacterium]|uniref:YHS domain-containing protein n=1 Tax=Candidatus Wunengus sp. YC65 TaxID=3367701 RepID=UPI001DE59AC8|nr:YHS domain-containing protein [Planctomycetota bacterium]
MNSIYRAVLVLTFVGGLIGGIYTSKVLWASDESYNKSGHTVQVKAEAKGEKAEAVKDPVCGMEVDNIKKAPSEKYKGKVYYFCSKKCVEIFKKGPAPYTCGCVTVMKDCDCGHCKGKEETCPCLSEKEEGETHEHVHEHTGVESHETKHKHD